MSLNKISDSNGCSLYQDVSGGESSVRRYVVSSAETAKICNDPLVYGLEYTDLLRKGCAKFLQSMQSEGIFGGAEKTTTVFHLLRGGLNFSLREALGDAFGWNSHNAAFISAQRARVEPGSSEWRIEESGYNKIYLRPENSIVFGDVVATGTSLEHGLRELVESARKQKAAITDITFFTIGGSRSHQILESLEDDIRSFSPNYTGASVVYIEGIFDVAENSSDLKIKIDGTDLLRSGILAPEFVESQYEKPTFSLERCTIYDAGSRSFYTEEYLEDVVEYWESVLKIAQEEDLSLHQYAAERMPSLDVQRLTDSTLADICAAHLEALKAL